MNKIKEKCEINNCNIPVLAKIVDMNPPEIEIKSPEDGSFVDAGEITVSGTVEDTSRNITVDVNGKKSLTFRRGLERKSAFGFRT